MTFEGVGKMFEGDFANTCAEKIPLVSMGGQAEGQACADPRSEDPHRRQQNLFTTLSALFTYFDLTYISEFCIYPENTTLTLTTKSLLRVQE